MYSYLERYGLPAITSVIKYRNCITNNLVADVERIWIEFRAVSSPFCHSTSDIDLINSNGFVSERNTSNHATRAAWIQLALRLLRRVSLTIVYEFDIHN